MSSIMSASGGFGSKKTATKADTKPPKKQGYKALKASYAIFCELKKENSKLFDVFVRGELSEGKLSGKFLKPCLVTGPTTSLNGSLSPIMIVW